MTFKELYAKISSQFPAYKSSGLLNEIDIYEDYVFSIKKFGGLPLELFEEVLEVHNGSVKLPENFRKLRYAIKCDPSHFQTKHTDHLQDSQFWRERHEKTATWDSCDTCCVEENEKFIVERLYYREYECKYFYRNPIELKLVQGVNRTHLDANCQNLKVRQSPYEINIIKGNILQTNFTKGTIFLRYRGLSIDEEGFVEIPDTFNGHLESYVESYILTNLMTRIISNGDNTQSEISLLSYYAQEKRNNFNLAMTELKANQFSKVARDKYRNKLRTESRKFDIITP